MNSQPSGFLQFRIQGSAAQPYTVRFEGAGENLQAFCTCPAGKQRGQFCKHIAVLLKGETKNIVEGAEQLPELQMRSQGSPLIERAQTHKASAPKPKQINLGTIQSLADITNHVTQKLAGTDCWCEQKQGENESEQVCVYIRKTTKTGKPSKKITTLISIKYEPYMRDTSWDADDGSWVYGDLRKKAMPWIVKSTNYGRFESAASRFLIELDILLDTMNRKQE